VIPDQIPSWKPMRNSLMEINIYMGVSKYSFVFFLLHARGVPRKLAQPYAELAPPEENGDIAREPFWNPY
jgi:hypothetical protein